MNARFIHPVRCSGDCRFFETLRSLRWLLLAAFRDSISVRSSKVKTRMRPIGCPEMSLNSYQHNLHSCTVYDGSIKSFICPTYLFTAWCRVLLAKLTDLQLVKKFPEFHGTPRSITAFTSARHPSLSWASPIQSIYRHPTSWRGDPS